jgi:hypothetical protein
MARQLILKKYILEKNFELDEAVAYDGFESFTGSQYQPCYVNTAVCSNSLYTMLWTFSPLNRKGRMTNYQKIQNKKLHAKFGRFPKDAIKRQTGYIVKELISMSDRPLILHTDKHKAYTRALKEYGLQNNVIHITTNSKEKRDSRNPLFPINHLHMWYRHFLSANKRETIAFNKNAAALMDNITLKTMSKNYMEPKIYNRSKNNKKHNKISPAMHLNLTNEILTFDKMFDYRRTSKQITLKQEDENLYFRKYPYSWSKIKTYKGI